ncbi:MAG: InlB B-repeat-containing protein [Kangiellaceae bacterium]
MRKVLNGIQKSLSLVLNILFIVIFSACGGGGGSAPANNGNGGNVGGGGGTTTQYNLSVTLNGSGSVSSSPAGITCGSDCSENFDENTSVTLTPTASFGFVFSSWSGDCSGSGDCIVSLTSDKNVTATFQQESTENFTLTVQTSAGGTVFSSPAGIDCGQNCSADFSSNTSVALSVTPDNGFIFDSWSGDCSGAQSCNLSMSENRSVTANFVQGTLSIAIMGNHEVNHGDVFNFQPEINGGATICRKDLGHDDVKVDSETGAISWDTSGLSFGRGFHIRIKCSNFNESVYASMVVHVDKSGTSQIRVAGENGVSPFIGIAGQAMTSGDTLIIPNGNYPVSVTRDESFENAFKLSSPTDGTADQYSTVIAESPGGVVINGEPHDGIGKQKNAFQLTANNFVAISGFVVKNVQRESFTASGGNNKLLVDFVGGQGAGTNLLPCDSFAAADSGDCSNAGMRINGGTGLFQNSYDWGHNRYGIMTSRTEGTITRRSFVRLDEHKGDQPYGGFSNYCSTLHLSQDNTVFDSLAIAAPHYKNYAGLAAYPATGCESIPATLKTEGLLAVNNDLSLSLMDVDEGPNHIWDHIVSYDSEGTCTPQTNLCGLILLQASRSKTVDVTNSFFGNARVFPDMASPDTAFGDNINLGSGITLQDVSSRSDTGTPPEYLPESLLYFRGRSDTFHGDDGFDTLTTSRRWPIPGEDIIAANMRSYFNAEALRVGGGTVEIDGNRGAVASGESMSEYFWGYTNEKVPPLVVRVKQKGENKRVAWEHLTGSRRSLVTGWKVICVSTNTEIASLTVSQLTFTDTSSCTQYGVRASYANGDSGIAYTETAEKKESK